ncbi:MAG: Mce-associated rane protein [Frankiales bacterium]|nr:Mce-associated rane protein [Frankiales bacterium]
MAKTPRRRPVVAGQRARQRLDRPPTGTSGEAGAAATTPPPAQGTGVAPSYSAPQYSAPVYAAPGYQVPGRRSSGYGVLTALLAAAVLLLAAAVWLIGLPTQPKDSHPETRVDALAAAQTAAVDLLSVNYETLEVGQKKAAAHLAPKFRGEYTKFFNDLQSTAVKNKLVLSSSVVASGVTSVKDADHVVVLLFIDQISTNAVRSSPRIDQNRVRLRMVRTGGHWLVEGLDAI